MPLRVQDSHPGNSNKDFFTSKKIDKPNPPKSKRMPMYIGTITVMLLFSTNRVTSFIHQSQRQCPRLIRMLATDSRSLQRRNEYFHSGAPSDDRNLALPKEKNLKNVVTDVVQNVVEAVTSSPLLTTMYDGEERGAPSRTRPGISTTSHTHHSHFGPDLPGIILTPEEEELFDLLTQVISTYEVNTTLRVAGGWVRDKLLANPDFTRYSSHLPTTPGVLRLTSKFNAPSKGRKGASIIGIAGDTSPLDIDIALDDMLGREFADLLNAWLTGHGRSSVSVGVVLKNPEKSKHLETATMKVGKFWIDFVNLRAEEYAEDSRIPDLMRIGTPEEDAYRRDLTINALYYNINNKCIEDFTTRGVEDLKKGIISTPLPPLTTLLDDPLRVLRSIRFAARLRFNMDDKLRQSARDSRVRLALAQKVSRERIGGELDLMLRSPDPVGAMRLLVNLNLIGTVFPEGDEASFHNGLALLTTTHDYLCSCKEFLPIWCQKHLAKNAATYGVNDGILMEDEDARRLLWYAAFLKPLYDNTEKPTAKGRRSKSKKANRSIVTKLMVDDLKRPTRDADAVQKIIKCANYFTSIINNGGASSAASILLNGVQVTYKQQHTAAGDTDSMITCSMLSESGRVVVHSDMVQDPIWTRAMEFREDLASAMEKIAKFWRAALILSLSEQLAELNHGDEFDVAIEGDVIEQSHEEIRQGIIDQYDTLAASIMQLGLVGIWSQKPLIDGDQMKKTLPKIPKGPAFRDVMDEQVKWMRVHPGGSKEVLAHYLKGVFREYAGK